MKFALKGSRFDNKSEKDTIHLNPALVLSVRKGERGSEIEMVNGKVYTVEGTADIVASLCFEV